MFFFALFAALRKTSAVQTVLTRLPREAAEFIKKGGMCAFPTETVYGLGADVFNESAIAKIFEAKRRTADNPLIAHIGELEQINLLTPAISKNAWKLIEAFFPGPLTIVLPKLPSVPSIATAGLETIGVRMPRNDLALSLLRSCDVPIVAPSANISGRPSPTTWEAVYEDLNGKIDCILQGGMTEIGLESTVVDCASDVPIVLRPGAVSIEQLQAIIPETRIYIEKNVGVPRSPGLKHRHYSPIAKVVLINSKLQISNCGLKAFIGLLRPGVEFDLVNICDSADDYAHSLFAFFRECDSRKIDSIYCQEVEEMGIGIALMDRLRRAARG